MDNKLRTGLISIAALIGGYTLLSNGSKYSMNAETFMAAGGKSRPVAMRENKIKDARELISPPLMNFFYNNPKLNKITKGINREDYDKYLKGDLKEKYQTNALFNRYASNRFNSFQQAVHSNMIKDYQTILNQKYFNKSVIDTKKYMLLCRIIVNRIKELQGMGVVSFADVSADVKFQNSLKSLLVFLKNLKIPYWSINRPFSYSQSINSDNIAGIIGNVQGAMGWLGLQQNYFGKPMWTNNNEMYWTENSEKMDSGKIRFTSFMPVQDNSMYGNNYAIDLPLDKSQLEELEELYFKNKEYYKYAQLLDYIQFFNKNPTIKYVAKIRNKGDKFYDKDIGDLDKFTRIKGLKDRYGTGILVKVWNNAEMESIFTLDKLEKMQEEIFNIYKEARVVVLRKKKTAGNRKEVLIERIAEFNKKSMSEFWNNYFNGPFNPADSFKPRSLDEAVLQYLALTSNRNSMTRIWSPKNLKIDATVKYVEQGSDGKYKIITTNKNSFIYLMQFNRYLGLPYFASPEFIFDNVTLTKDFREKVNEQVDIFYKNNISKAKEAFEKAKDKVRILENNYKKLSDKYK
tara:strand:- start:5255 stop:6973 length:1719 start_codon:yes stop_codon:yes gene_type:complete